MPGACMTCTGTCGSGARTGTARITTRTLRWTIPQGPLLAPSACTGAVAGLTLRGLPAATVSGTCRSHRNNNLGFRVALDVSEQSSHRK